MVLSYQRLFLVLPVFLMLSAALMLSGVLGGSDGNAATAVYSPDIHIYDDATGGDCASIGTWDWPSKTCTLTMDLIFAADGIELAGDGITLDGNGHTLTGTSYGNGAYSFGYNDVTIRNLTVTGFDTKGIGISDSTGATVADNQVLGNYFGILFSSASGGTVSGNTVLDSGNQGISFNVSSNNNVVTGNYIRQTASKGSGISVFQSDGNLVSGNDASSSKMYGIGIVGVGNDVRDNMASGSSAGITIGRFAQVTTDTIVLRNTVTGNKLGLLFSEGHDSIVTGNTVSGNTTAAMKFFYSNNNAVYNNNFISNPQQVLFEGTSSSNVFNLAAPAGGNYWDVWTSPDVDSDGFVDNPLVFIAGQQDNLPYTVQDGWCSQPSLSLNRHSVYWGSLADYSANILSVDYTIDSFFDIYDERILASTNNQGVTMVTPVPVLMGESINAGAGSSLPVTLKYHIPFGVTTFFSTTYAAADDVCGNTYYYPGPPPP